MAEPAHRVRLGADGWSVWREFVLRAPGFSADSVLRLAAPAAASAADALLDVEAERADVQRRCYQLIARAEQAATDKDERKALARALKKLLAGGLPEVASPSPELTALVASLRRLDDEIAVRRQAALTSLGDDTRRCRAQLIELGSEARFREALLWQNPGFVHNTLDSLLRKPDDYGSNARRQELAVASYLQRYCTKNDTIGFFGPVGWGQLVDEGQPIRLEPGPSLLATRTVYFEHWAIALLAEKLGEDEALRPELRPRRWPMARVDGDRIVLPVERTVEVEPAFARALDLCNGERTAREIAAALLAEARLDVGDEDEAFDVLRQLEEKKLIIWSIELPHRDAFPERVLRGELERLPPSEARARALAALDELERARDALAAAAGDAGRVEAAIDALQATVERLIGTASRRAGSSIAGRNSFYEDCRRDLRCAIGAPARDRLAAPLELMLTTARWYTHRVASGFRQALEAEHRALAAQTGSTTIDYLRFFAAAQRHFSGEQDRAPSIVQEAVVELQQRWAELLGIDLTAPPDERRAAVRLQSRELPGKRLRSVDLRARAETLFAAPGPGWPSARHQSPDLMIAAESADAVARGDFQWVVGELHTGFNSAWAGFFAAQHPDFERLKRAQMIDVDGLIVRSLTLREDITRFSNPPTAARVLHVETGSMKSFLPRDSVVPVSELLVDLVDDELVVRSRDGRHVVELMVFVEQLMLHESGMQFAPMPKLPRLPRISIDDLVIARAQWRFSGEELSFNRGEDPNERFLAVRRWARAHALPRFCFYRVPEEPKPVYLDLDSPLYVELFSRLTRKASALSVSEMLPRLDQLWLTDAEGRRYTGELRVIAVDPREYRRTR